MASSQSVGRTIRAVCVFLHCQPVAWRINVAPQVARCHRQTAITPIFGCLDARIINQQCCRYHMGKLACQAAHANIALRWLEGRPLGDRR